MSPTPEVEGCDPAHVMLTPRKSQSPSGKKTTPTLIGGCRRVTPSKSGRKTPRSKVTGPSPSSQPRPIVNPVTEEDGRGSPSVEKPEPSFQDHKEMCDRVAKSLYFANKLPTTPRPSLPLTRLAVSTFTRKARQDTLEILDLEQAAEIGRNACISPTALIMSIVYLERLSSSNPGYLGNIKPSELFVVSLLVASKFIQDDGEELGIFNDEWATSADLDIKQLNRLELQFLTAIDWNVKVDPEEYGKVLEWLEKEVSMEEGSRRGWFTYSEVTTLLSFHLLWPTIYEHCVKVITAACVTYATILATLMTSSIYGPQIFMMSKTCLTALTATTPPFNSTTNVLHLGTNCLKLAQDQNQEMDTDNLDLDGQQTSPGRFGFENGSDTAIDIIARSKMWARPGQTPDPVFGYHHQTHYGLTLTPESLFTNALQSLLQNQNLKRQQKHKTDTNVFTVKCNPRASHRQTNHMGRCSSDYKNDRFSSFGHGLPYYIK